MLRFGIILLVAAVVLGALGFGGLGSLAWTIGGILAVIGLILAVIHFIGSKA